MFFKCYDNIDYAKLLYAYPKYWNSLYYVFVSHPNRLWFILRLTTT